MSFLFLISVGVAIVDPACAGTLPRVTAAMRSPRLWLDRHSAPDKVLMAPAEITAFNKGLVANRLTDDLAAYPHKIPLVELRAEAFKAGEHLRQNRLFRRDGSVAGDGFFTPLRQNMNFSRLGPWLVTRYAVATTFTRIRCVPTEEPLYAQRNDTGFDEVQDSGISAGTPVVVLHETADNRWFFIKDGVSSGWVRARDIALTDEDAWRAILAPKIFVVITAPRARVCLGPGLWFAAATARMGDRFALKGQTPQAVEVVYALRRADGRARWVSAFIARNDVAEGDLPYTPRAAITQAFKLLDAPYGWGDSNGGQDCSRFIRMVFATMGFDLPRNSAQQARAGLPIAEFDISFKAPDKAEAIARQALAGATLLCLKGHVMLYLGEVDGGLYAIHATSGYREMKGGREVFVALGRVVVSDLSPGSGTSKGSLLERVRAVRFIR